MIAAGAIAWALLIAWAAGGKFANLAQVRLSHELLIALLFVGQSIFRGRLPFWDGAAHDWAVFFWGLASLALLATLIPDAKLPGIGVAILGIAANLTVVLANEGMPYVAAGGAVLDSGAFFYRTGTIGTSLLFLGDVLPVPSGAYLLSLGDILLGIGVMVFIVAGSVAGMNGSTTGTGRAGR
ncbi:MAG: DUF5317 family protein [Coriobacteriia bacterium]|nr:DUF5317 family protein [Coriobacteriia bacterium]